ncbi:hypothetical protein EDB19DRAFT_1905893 [Suillus lakei]|nr:hypothetical protein EDB19DRAFT_1915080 [Suillus lakei]KAG1746441.1 hypothetical protein EDB19DRAFT_1905893 [Suillus lakei]
MHIYQHPIELSFPLVCGIHPSLTLKTAVVHACDNEDGALFDFVPALTNLVNARLEGYIQKDL